MDILPKIIWKEAFSYYSDNSVDGLKKDIQQLFSQSKERDFSINLTGKFTAEFEFQMIPKWQLAVIRNFEREESYLNGTIFSDEENRTRVDFTVRPNSIVPIFFFLFPMFGLIALTAGNENGNMNQGNIVGFVFAFVVPTGMALFGYFAKQSIKKRFVETFDLKPIE